MNVVVFLFFFLLGPSAFAATTFNMVTASERGTYFRFCTDLAQLIAQPAGMELGCLPSKGSVENIKRLRYEPGVKLAMVQSDVWQTMLDLAPSSPEGAQIIRPLRVIVPLYDEEIYLIVRADSPMKFIHEIRGKKLSVGAIGSGTAATMGELYYRMFHEPLPPSEYLSNEDGLVKLLQGTVDVVAVTGGQPMPLLANMAPEAKAKLKILRLDASNPAAKLALTVYTPATVRQLSYPNLLDADFPTLAVKALLVTYDFGFRNVKQKDSALSLVKLTQALCDNFGELIDKGHSKWRDVSLATPPLGSGWIYYAPTQKALAGCSHAAPAVPEPVPVPPASDKCSQEMRLLGLCQ